MRIYKPSFIPADPYAAYKGKGFTTIFAWLGSKSPADLKKEEFIEMAKRGEPRPTKRSSKNRKAFLSYIDPSSPHYDAKFVGEIESIQREWIYPIDTVEMKKKALLAIAASGEPKPHRSTPLGEALQSYTNKSHKCYNKYFRNKVRTLRPEWFDRSLSGVAISNGHQARKERLGKAEQSP